MTSQSRNRPCPCGSGRKYKRCCAVTAGEGAASATQSSVTARVATITLPDGRIVLVSDAMQAALQLHRVGRPRKAAEIYDLILQVERNNADALHLKGVTARQIGDHDAAVSLISRAIGLNPNVGMYHYNLGETYRVMNRLNKAVVECKQAVALQPDFPEAHFSLGRALRGQGKLDEAIAHFERVLLHRPDYADAHVNLGEALTRQGKFDQAIAHYERALALKPDSVEAHINMGITFAVRQVFDQAIVHYERALALKPDSVEAYNSLGNVFSKQDKWEQAIAHYERALALKPDSPLAHNNLASALTYQRKFDQAIAHYERAVTLDPRQPQFYSNLLQTLNYVPGYDAAALFAAHRTYASQYEEPLARFVMPHSNDRSPGRRLKIGYVSTNFRQHSIAHFIEPVLEHCDHGQFEVICYSNSAAGDIVTDRIRSCADAWRLIMGLSDEQAVQQIREDRIDILVDLDGHCGMNRLPVFARKPAPIQVAWIGYPNTTGLSAMDYRITDAYADPVGSTDYLHSEKLLRLPDCFSCYRPPQDCPDVGDLPAQNRGYVTFGSFNALVKTSAEVMALWARLMRAVPASRLALKSKCLEEPSSQEEVKDFFSAHGIARERLMLLGHSPSQTSHMEHYNRIDIGLDPFPYNGTTTTCDALWMGVPVVTLAGKTHVSRVGVSQMNTLGLPELIAGNPEEYISIAVRLAGDLDALSGLRRGLRLRMKASPLTDAPRLTRNLEHAYRDIWQRWCVGH